MKITGRNHLTMTRSDAEYIKILPNPQFPLEDGDVVHFTVKPWCEEPEKELDDLDPVIEIDVTEFTPGQPTEIKIPTEATRDLPYGDYFYDIEIEKANGDPQTIIKAATLTLTLEVHRH